MDFVEPATPEHDKHRAVKEESDQIGAFLEWLIDEQHVHLHVWGDAPNENVCLKRDRSDGGMALRGDDFCYQGHIWSRTYGGSLKEDKGVCPKCNGTGYYQTPHEDWIPWGKQIPSILAAYFKIDEKAYHAETEAVYQLVRAMADANNR